MPQFIKIKDASGNIFLRPIGDFNGLHQKQGAHDISLIFRSSGIYKIDNMSIEMFEQLLENATGLVLNLTNFTATRLDK